MSSSVRRRAAPRERGRRCAVAAFVQELKAPSRPRVAVVCMQYGAAHAAELLKRSGVPTIAWIGMHAAVSKEAVLIGVIKPLLDADIASRVVFVPADASPQELRDCLHEELAQALGPLNGPLEQALTARPAPAAPIRAVRRVSFINKTNLVVFTVASSSRAACTHDIVNDCQA